MNPDPRQVAQAREAGYSDDEINAHLTKKGYRALEPDEQLKPRQPTFSEMFQFWKDADPGSIKMQERIPGRKEQIEYKKVAGILLVVLLFTGGVNLHYVNQVMTSQTQLGIQHNAKYLTIFFIKLGLVLCLMTLFLYTVIFKSDEDDDAEVEYEAIPYQRAALWMGFFIILCASALKHLHQ